MADTGSNDGILLVQLAQWGAMLGIQDAVRAVYARDFDPETADSQQEDVSLVLTWGETIGTLTKHGLISRELILDWLWVAGLWDRVGHAARADREEHGEPGLYANFEALARAQAE